MSRINVIKSEEFSKILLQNEGNLSGKEPLIIHDGYVVIDGRELPLSFLRLNNCTFTGMVNVRNFGKLSLNIESCNFLEKLDISQVASGQLCVKDSLAAYLHTFRCSMSLGYFRQVACRKSLDISGLHLEELLHLHEISFEELHLVNPRVSSECVKARLVETDNPIAEQKLMALGIPVDISTERARELASA